jgi:multidrug efflux pump subunit AcrB
MQELPPGVGYEWTGTSLQERQSASQAPLLYALSILVVFLALAALYESWTVPISVVMVVLLGILGALVAAFDFAQGLLVGAGLEQHLELHVNGIEIVGPRLDDGEGRPIGD